MGFVYILRVGGRNLFKVGKASDLERRLKAHATSSADRLTQCEVIPTEHPSDVERYLKHRLRWKRFCETDATEIYEIDPDELAGHE